MSTDSSHIDFDLVAKVLSGEASQEEHAKLEAWSNASAENKAEVDELRMLWNVSKTPAQPEVNIDRAWEKVSEATSGATVIDFKPEHEEAASKAIQPAASKTWWAWAAAIAVLCAVGMSLWFGNGAGTQTLTASTGNQVLELADGSIVTLAQGARMTYPDNMASGERTITLEGRAFFDVESDAKRPFVIETPYADVTVLGTRFEVNTSEIESAFEVRVEEGRVQVEAAKSAEKAIVTANEICRVAKGDGALETAVLSEAAPFFWKDRIVRFRGTDLRKASEILSDLFQKEIILEVKNTQGCEITATFEDEDLSIILEIISSTLNLNLEKTANGFKLVGEGC